jgi:hypothetical protein
LKNEVAEAGLWAIMDIARIYGRLPLTISECEEVTQAYAIRALPVGTGAGKLVVDMYEIPTILYDATRSLTQQKCAIIHELVEWLLIEKYPALVDADVRCIYHQSGGECPSDMRHLAAAHAEWIYAEWLKRQ